MAVAEYADDPTGKLPPPPDLVDMWQFRTFATLPRAGGLSDQPAGKLARMRHAEQVYRVYAGYNRAPNLTRWSRENPGALKLKLNIDKMRELA